MTPTRPPSPSPSGGSTCARAPPQRRPPTGWRPAAGADARAAGRAGRPGRRGVHADGAGGRHGRRRVGGCGAPLVPVRPWLDAPPERRLRPRDGRLRGARGREAGRPAGGLVPGRRAPGPHRGAWTRCLYRWSWRPVVRVCAQEGARGLGERPDHPGRLAGVAPRHALRARFKIRIDGPDLEGRPAPGSSSSARTASASTSSRPSGRPAAGRHQRRGAARWLQREAEFYRGDDAVAVLTELTRPSPSRTSWTCSPAGCRSTAQRSAPPPRAPTGWP